MVYVILVVIALFLLIFIYNFVRQRQFVSLFSKGNVMVSGLRGRGKDLAFCYVINKRKRNYISNVQYSNPKCRYKRFDFDTKVWELAGNDFKSLVDGDIKSYVYPYPDGIDYYISDAGVYFPAQYQSELVKRYKGAPMFQALSRHLGDCNIHTNTQSQNRLWDKLREQSDIYLVMRRALFIPKTKFFLLTAYLYSSEEAAEKQIIPPRFGFGKEAKSAKYNFEITHGKIKRITFFARLPYSYDSRRFKKILENNCVDYEA